MAITRRIFKVALLLAAILIGTWTLQSSISLAGLKPGIIRSFSKDAGLDLKIFGEVKASILPKPSLILTQVRLDLDEKTQIEIPKLVMVVKPTTLLSSKIEMSALEVTGAQFTKEAASQIASHIFTSTSSKPVMQYVTLQGVSLVMDSSNIAFFDKLTNISGTLEYKPSKALRFSGSFDFNDLNHVAMADFVDGGPGNAPLSTFSITNPFAKVTFNGNVRFQEQYTVQGKFNASLYNSIHSSIAVPMVYQVLLHDNLKIEGDIIADHEKFSAQGVKLSSASISKILLNATMPRSNSGKVDVNIESDSINLDKLFDINNTGASQFTFEDFLKAFLLSFNFVVPADTTGDIMLKCNEVILNAKPITNIAFNGKMADQKFVLENFSMNLPAQTSLGFQGVLSHNEIRPKFDGKATLTVGNTSEFGEWSGMPQLAVQNASSTPLTATSDVDIIPRSLRFQNIRYSYGDTKISGRADIEHSGEPRLRVSASIGINEIDADALKWSEAFDNFIGDLYATDFDKTGRQFYQITNDFKALREFPINLELDVFINKFRFKAIDFPSAAISTQVSPNSFAITRMSINTSGTAISGSAALITSALVPKVTADIHALSLDTSFIDHIMPDHNFLLNKQNAALTTDAGPSAASIVPGSANFFGLNNIAADFKLQIDALTSKQLSAQNILLWGQSQDGVLSIDKLQAGLFGGNLQLAGNVVVASAIPSYSATFALNNFMLAPLLSFYTNYSALDGYMSISGNMFSKGADWNSFYSNLDAKINMLGKKLTWNTFDIGEIVKLSEYKSSFNEKASKLKSLTTTGKSLFDSMQGVMTINKGIATLTDIKFNNSRVSGAMSASIDIKNHLISNFTRISFIPTGFASPVLIDIVGRGPISGLNPQIKYDSYLQLLRNAYNYTGEEQITRVQTLLDNRR